MRIIRPGDHYGSLVRQAGNLPTWQSAPSANLSISEPMVHPILGLHHVTATVDDAQADLDFCVDLLGMRLVKKTVNFDNHDV